MIKSSTKFMYNGISSENMGVINASISTGLYSEPFLPSIELKETIIRRRKIPYLLEVRKLPLEFQLVIAFTNDFTEYNLSQVKQWFNVNFYCPMIFQEDQSKIYYCMPVKDTIIEHNGKIGYVTVNFRCQSPYSYSLAYSSPIYDLTANSTSTNVSLFNQGDITLNPTIIATIVSGSSFSITNTTNANQQISFTGLTLNEVVTIDCENQEVYSSLSSTYRINNMTGKFLDILVGNNVLSVVGNIKLQFQYEYMFLP